MLHIADTTSLQEDQLYNWCIQFLDAEHRCYRPLPHIIDLYTLVDMTHLQIMGKALNSCNINASEKWFGGFVLNALLIECKERKQSFGIWMNINIAVNKDLQIAVLKDIIANLSEYGE